MSVQKAKISNDLGIETDRVTYAPGDTVSGVVYRSSPIVGTEASIDLTFHGRTKSYIDYRSGSVTYTYRGEFALFRQEQNLLRGPLHIPSKDRQQWHFTFTIPTNIDARLYPGEYSEKLSYIPIDSDSISKRELPASVSVDHGGARGCIEYLLEATLKSQGQGSASTEKAILPLRIVNVDPNPPITNFDLQIAPVDEETVHSQRLVPGKENIELSTSDKMKKFFGTSSVPKIVFKFEVGVPKVLQLNSEATSFTMRLIPNWPETSEAIREKPQKVKLVKFKAWLKYEFDIVGSDSGDPYTDYASEKVELLSNKIGGDIIEIPCTDGKAPPADIGAILKLRLADNTIPRVDTFNIKTTKQKLHWNATCEIANETFSADGSQEVTILPASSSSSWMAPPEDVPPPSFADVQREDEKKGVSSTTSEYPKEKQ